MSSKILYMVVLLICLSFQLLSQRILIERLATATFSKNTRVYDIERDELGFLWLGTNNGLYRFDGENFERFNQVGKEVNTLCVDSQDAIWLGSSLGLLKISSSRDKIQNFTVENKLSKIYSIELGINDDLFVLSEESGLSKVSTDGQIEDISNTFDFNSLYSNAFLKVCIDSKGQAWVKKRMKVVCYGNANEIVKEISIPKHCTEFVINRTTDDLLLSSIKKYGILQFDQKLEKKKEIVLSSKRMAKESVRSNIMTDNDGNVWVSHMGALFFYSTKVDSVFDFQDIFLENFERHSFIYSIYQLESNVYYLGSNTGLYKLKILQDDKEIISRNDVSAFVSENEAFSVRSLHLNNESIYIGSYAGLFKYDIRDKEFEEIEVHNTSEKRNPVAYSMLADDIGNLYIASESYGLLKMKDHDKKAHVLGLGAHEDVANIQSHPKFLFSLMEHNKGLLLGTIKGLYKFNESSIFQVATGNQVLNASTIYHICKHNGIVYIGTAAGLFQLKNGLYSEIQLDIERSYVINYTCPIGDVLWIGTRGDGLLKYDTQSKKTTSYAYDQGVNDPNINAILPGEGSEIWFSTNSGLCRLDGENEQVTNYFTKGELDWTEFNHNAAAKSENNIMYFGGIGGVVGFNPSILHEKEHPSSILITKIVQQKGDGDNLLTRTVDLDQNDKIQLAYNDNYFSVEFTKSNLELASGDHFQYRIVGKEWINIGNKRTLQFTDLNAGTYDLQIKGTNQEGGTISMLSIPIIVEEVFYKTWFAYCFYVVVLLLLAWWVFRNLLLRSKLESKLKLERDYSSQLQSLNKTRTKIFTNLAHEFQTPLTLIQGPALKIDEVSVDIKIKSWAQAIAKHSFLLTDMVQQLLKLSRMDEGRYEFKWHEGDVMSLLRGVVQSFQQVAVEQNKSLLFEAADMSFMGRYDEDKIIHIVKNLITNALKFTSSGDEIIVEIHCKNVQNTPEHSLQISVKDNGIGIAPEHHQNIFERFCQVEDGLNQSTQGTGIGLSLVKEFVVLLNGTIFLESEKDVGSNFIVKLPIETISQKELMNVINTDKDLIASEIEVENKTLQQDTILIVEDNLEIQNFIVDCIPDNFRVIKAVNGQIGYESAVENLPDLVITDIMMPVMDGLALTRELKTNSLTCHIPCVILTAKNETKNRLAGRKSGVDAYLTKPFHPEELVYVIQNMFSLRNNLVKEAMNNDRLVKHKDAFMNSFSELIDRELDNEQLQIEDVTRELAISRTQLHRKIKSLTGKSTSQYIREYRLLKAKYFLLNGTTSVSEVCYRVGFANPSYFAARFKEYFGHLPSELR